jgi:hypothetical protein
MSKSSGATVGTAARCVPRRHSASVDVALGGNVYE